MQHSSNNPQNHPKAHRSGWAYADAKAARNKGTLQYLKKKTKKALRRLEREVIAEGVAEYFSA